MLRCASHFLLIGWSALALCSALQAAPAEPAAIPVTPSVVPVTLTLDSGRMQQALAETLGTDIQRGVAQDKLYDGAVSYKLTWSVNPGHVKVNFGISGKAVLLELTTKMDLEPSFTLNKGADKIYAAGGCERTSVSLNFSVKLATKNGQLVATPQPANVNFPRRYSCLYERNILGDVRNIFSKDTKKEVNVVPLMTSGIKAQAGYLSDRLNSAISALAVGDSLRQQLNNRFLQPWQITPNLWLWAKVLEIKISTLSVANEQLTLQGKLATVPHFGFGNSPPQPLDEPSAAQPEGDRFHIPFDLLIPRDPLAVNTPESIEMSRPQYRFRAVSGAPGVAALQRYQVELEEDVVLLESGARQSAGERIPMEGPIGAVLDEIVDWLEHNAGVRNAATGSDRLLREVRRAAAVVAHFQRPRTLTLDSVGALTLSNLSADLQWVSLEQMSVRAKVNLTGQASLKVAL